MPRVSKRKKQEAVQAAPQIKYYRTCIYVRLSRKDGGHGRRDSLSVQKQICMDFAKKHPEMLISNIYEDNGVTGTTFEREAFGQLMNEVRAGKVDCIIVKDFARFGRDALEAVDLIDVIFPSLDVRFISILDDYDSENPACVQDRVSNILKHFMNDYYAREVSAKLVQAHKQSRERGEFWGRKPPYGYKWSQESKKNLIPDEDEKKIVQQIFDWYVFEEMSSYDIVKELNASGVWTPQESHELREYGKRRKEEKLLWNADSVRRMLQNPVCIGAAVYGKTRRMLSENMPLYLVPRQEWEIQEDVREPLVEKTVFEKALEILKERRRESLNTWAVNKNKMQGADGMLLGKIFCKKCRKRLDRIAAMHYKGHQYYSYRCHTPAISNNICSLRYVNEKYVLEAVTAALKYQIRLAVDCQRQYGSEFYRKLDAETKQTIKRVQDRYESYDVKLQRLFEHYATGLLERDEYSAIKKSYSLEQKKAHEELEQIRKRSAALLDSLRARMDWAEELLKYQNFTEITREIVEQFIEKVFVENYRKIEVSFWFGDLFQREMDHMEGGPSDAI